MFVNGLHRPHALLALRFRVHAFQHRHQEGLALWGEKLAPE